LRAGLKPAGRGLWGPFRDEREIWSVTRLSFGVVVIVLLVACGNIANLLLAHGASRRREIAVRLSLGATRSRLVRQMLIESFLLAALGLVAGLFFAQWSNSLLVAAKPANVPLVTAHLDLRVVGFAAAISLLTGLLFGLVPALQAARQDLNSGLKDDSRTASGAGSGIGVRRALIVCQMAFSLLLLIGAGLCWRSFNRLQSVNPGFEYDRLVTVTINADAVELTKENSPAFHRELLDQMSAIPGVISSSFADSAPFHPTGWMSGPGLFDIEGYSPKPGESYETRVHIVGPNYFATLSAQPNLATRLNGKRERTLVNESFARRFWPGLNPLGKRLGERQVDGVIPDFRLRDLWQRAEPEIYWQREQPLGSQFSLLLRVRDEPLAVMAAVRTQVASFNPALRVVRLEPVSQTVYRSLGAQRFAAVLMGNLALAALFLAAVGMYGVTSFLVTQRTHEIGIRMALGAQQRQAIAIILSEGLKLIVGGAILGTAAALALSRALSSRLYEVTPTDPQTFLLVPILLAVVGLFACWLPARRAAEIDPMTALRCE
jgi:predicted permease